MMLPMLDTPDYIHRALDAGASGYVLKQNAVTDLLFGIRSLAGGKHFFSQKIVGIAEKYLEERGNQGSAS